MGTILTECNLPWHHRAVAISSREKENTREEFLECLLDLFPEPYAMLSAFQDESCTHDGAISMGVTSVLYERGSLTKLNKEWTNELKRAGIRQFHKADSAGLHGEFEGKTHDFADQLYRKLVAIIAKRALGSVTACDFPVKGFDVLRSKNWGYSPYTICSCLCMIQVTRLAATRLGHDQVTFFIEDGHEKESELKKTIKELRASGLVPGIAGYGFHDKSDLHALSTADVIAYETTKRIKDRSGRNGTKLRKSLDAITRDNRNHQILPITEQMVKVLVSGLSK
jgi:hypothetical protein